MIWKYARRELSQKIQLKLGEQNALLLSQHNSLVSIISAALGGGKKNGPTSSPTEGYRDVGAGHSSVEDAVAAINKAMSF